jgi:hypothetical protein
VYYPEGSKIPVTFESILTDESALLHRLTLIETSKVRGRGFMMMEWLKRGYSRITLWLMGEDGSLTIMVVIIAIKSLREYIISLKKLLSYLAPKND